MAPPVTISLDGVPEWTELGPAAILDDDGMIEGTGAIVDIARHPEDAAVIFVATSGGGVWRTRDATAESLSPSWEPLTDPFPSPAMGAIAFDPSDSDRQTLYAGTGSFASFGPSGTGVGLYKTVDGGDTWRIVGASELSGRLVRSILPLVQPNGGVVLVAAIGNVSAGGIWRSIDGGASFSELTGAPSSGLLPGDGLSLLEDPARPGTVYAAVGGSSAGVYRSADAGETWVRASAGIVAPDLAFVHWIRLALRPGSPTSTLYAAILDNNRRLGSLYWTSAVPGQEFWSPIPFPAGGGDVIYATGKPWKFAIAADPGRPALILAADSAVWRAGLDNPDDPEWETIDAKEKGHNVNVGGPHQDCQALVFDAEGNLLVANDGGIYRLLSPGTADRAWVFIGGRIRNDEPLGLAYDTLARVATAGCADNGSCYQRHPGDRVWRLVTAGDGGDQGVDNGHADFSWRYEVGAENASLANLTRRKFDRSNRLLRKEAVELGGMPDADKGESAGFVMNNLAEAGARLLVGGTRLFESVDGGKNVTLVLDLGPSRPTRPMRIAYGSRSNGSLAPEVAYVGVGNQLWLRGPGESSFTQLGAYTGGVIAHVAVDQFDWQRAYVVDDTHVYATSDAGVSFSECTGNLLDVVTNGQSGENGSQIQRVLVYRSGADTAGEAVLVGAFGGIFRTLNASDGPGAVWRKFGRNLPGCYGTELKYYPARPRGRTPTGDVLLATMYGRGAWLLEAASTELLHPAVLVIEGHTGRDTIRLALNEAVPGRLEVYDTAEGGSPRAIVPLASLDRIVVHCRGDEETLILDCSHGVIDVHGGIDYRVAGGSRNTLVIVGGAVSKHLHQLRASGGVALVGAMRVTYQGVQRIDDSARAARMQVELGPGADELEISNGRPLDGSPTMSLRVRRASAQLDLDVTNQGAVALDLRKGVGTTRIDFRERPARLRLLSLVSGPGRGDVRIASTPAGVETRVEGGGGADGVAVGSLTGSSGRTTDLLGPIRLSNRAGKTWLSVAADENADPMSGILSDRSLTGLSPGRIDFAPTELAGLTVFLGAGSTLRVEDTAAPTTVLGGTNLSTLEVLGTTASLEYVAGQGVDAVHVGEGSLTGIRGPLLVRASTRGNVHVTVDDSDSDAEKEVVITSRGLAGLTPAEITLAAGANPFRNTLTIKSGRARGFYSVIDTPPLYAVTIHGQGQDVVNLAGNDQPFEVDGARAVSIGGALLGVANIRDSVTIGAGGPTTLTVDNRGATATAAATLNDLAITGLTPKPIAFPRATLGALHLLCGRGGNTTTVTATRSEITTSVSLGAGRDLVSVIATAGPLLLEAHAGSGHRVVVGSTAPEDRKADLHTIAGEVRVSSVSDIVDLVIGDGAGRVARSGEITPNGIFDLGSAPIRFGPLHSLSLRLSQTGSSLLVSGTPTGGAATVWTGGHDTVLVKPPRAATCDLVVEGPQQSADTLRVLVDRHTSTTVEVTPPTATEPGTIRVTDPGSPEKLVTYRNIETVSAS